MIKKFIIKLIKPLTIPAVAAILLLILYVCGYVVLPEGIEFGASRASKGWSAAATGIEKTDSGGLRIDLTIRNETGDWSAMQAIAGRAAVLTDKEGKTTNCPAVFVGTGGHRVAPDFHIHGFQCGNRFEPVTQMIYVECPLAHVSPGSKLSIAYHYVTGQYNYYNLDNNRVETNRVEATLEVDLDNVTTDVKYPISAPVEGLIQKHDIEITALNEVVLTLTGITRTEQGVQFTWQTFNPGEYPTYVHIGNPPVIGADGILYGFYISPDRISVPITPAGKSAEWTTEVAVLGDVKDLYIMLSVESGKARLLENYCLDITDKYTP
jgi:hypothetical protein